jgi:hypothetical protein
MKKEIDMKIYTATHHTIYIGNTDITLVVIKDNVFDYLTISSVNNSNKEKLFIDNILYIKHIEDNKRDLKQKLTEKGLWEKGVVKAIKLLSKKVI